MKACSQHGQCVFHSTSEAGRDAVQSLARQAPRCQASGDRPLPIGVPSAAPGFSAETQNSALWFLQLKAHLSPLQSKARKASADSGFNCIQVRHDSTGCVTAIGARLTLSILGPYLEMGGSRRDPHCGCSPMLALGGYHWWLS